MNTIWANYPDFDELQEILAAQAGGFAGWCLLVALGVLVLVLIRLRWPNPQGNPRLHSRLAFFVAFCVMLSVSYRQALYFLPIGAAIVVVAASWSPYIKRVPSWWLLLGLAVVVRLPLLFEPFWYDETFSAELAKLPYPRMFQVILGDVHPPGWYTVEWLAYRLFGGSEAALRLPSLLAGVATVLLAGRLARALGFQQRTAIIAAVLVAVLPAHVYYSAEARAYAGLTLIVVVSLLGVLENRKLWFALAAPLALMFQTYGYLYVAVLGLAALVLHRREWRRWVMAIAPGVLVGTLWLPILLTQTADVSNGFWLTVTPAAVLKPLQSMTVGLRLDERIILPVTGATIGASLLTLLAGRCWILTGRGLVWLALVLGVPALAAAITFVWSPIYLDRALLPCAVVLVVGWAWLLSETHPGDRIAAASILVPALSLALLSSLSPSNGRIELQENLDLACRDTDSIYNTSVSLAFMSNYYADLPSALWPPAGDLNQTLPESALAALGWNLDEFEDMRGTICVLNFETPMSRADERAYIDRITSGAPGRLIATNDVFSIYAHVVNRND